MFTLATGETLQGVAASGSAVSYTLTGDEKSATTDSFKVLAQGQLPAVAGSLGGPTGANRWLVQKIFLKNTTGTAQSIVLYINGVAGTNQIVGMSIEANGSAILSHDGWHTYDSAGKILFVGSTGATGEKGWSPVLAVVTDGARRVFQIVDWVGGAGTKPSVVNQFIGSAGIVGTAALAEDIRGPIGATGPAANAFGVVTGNTGTATADTGADTLAITGANGTTTAATDTPDGLVITGPNAFGVVTGNSGTANADSGSDTLAMTGVGAINVTATDTPDGVVISVPNNTVTDAMLSDMGANALKANATGSTADPADLTITPSTFPARSSTGNLAAKPIADLGLAWLALSTTALQTATLDLATTVLKGLMSAQDKIRMGAYLDAQADFGFVDDLRGTGDGTCSTGAPTKITSASAAFVAGDNGKRITLAGAGASGAMYVGVITAIDSGTQVTVSPSVSTTVTNRVVQLGTDNTTPSNNLLTAINTTNALYPGLGVQFGRNPGTGRTGRYGMPIPLPFVRPVLITGTGRGFTADQGVADQLGGVSLCWWGTTADGGTAFGAFISFRSNQNNNMKGTGLRDLSVDCGNGTQYGPVNQTNTEALIGVKLATVNGFSWNNVFIRNPGAMGIWCDIDATPTEQESTSRGMITNVAFRCLDSGPVAITTPFLMTSAVTLTTTPQNLTVAANGLPASGYFWTTTAVGMPVLVNYTGGGGTTTLTGCTCSAEAATLSPLTVANANIVQAVPSNSSCAVMSGNATANTNLSIFAMWQMSIGTTWGPAAIECMNADSLVFQQMVVNGGSGTDDGAINRIRRPGARFNGHNASLSLAARNNVFYDGDAGAGGVSNMALLNTGAKMLAPAGPNYWWGYQLGNGASQPKIEAGGYFDWTANGGATVGFRAINLTAAVPYTVGVAKTIPGSEILLGPQGIQVGTGFRWTYQAAKTLAGAANRLVHIRIGATGTAADAIVMTFTLTTTAVVDSGVFEIVYVITTANSASSTGVGAHSVIARQLIATATGLVAVLGCPVNIGTPTVFTSPVSSLQYISLSITTGAAEVLTTSKCVAEVLRAGSQAA